MYHIINDKRAKTSARMIYEALIELLKTKPFEKITVSDIVSVSTVGRPTFYRCFDSTIDILSMRMDECFIKCHDDFFKKYDSGEAGQGDFLLHFLTFWCKNSSLIELLLEIDRIDIIYSSHFNTSAVVTDRFLPEMDQSSTDYEFFMMFRSSIFIGLMRTWIKDGKKMKPEELLKYNVHLQQLVNSDLLF